MRTYFYPLLCLFVLLFCCQTIAEDIAETQETDAPLPQLKEIPVSGPYCGIYSLIACLDVFSIHPKIETLLVPDFVGSFQGSSDDELINAAKENGIFGKTFANLTWQELQRTESPMILHFRNSFADQQFNHWVAYLGVDGGKARIIDMPNELETIPFAELMAKWDGTAILLSKEPIHEELTAFSRLNYLTLVAWILGVLWLIQHFVWAASKEAFAMPTLFLRAKHGIAQTATLLGVLFVLGILYHAFADVGFLKNPSAVAEVTRRYYSVHIPEISLAEMKTLVADESIPLFDARYVRDYNAGTIARAKSLSIGSSLTERQSKLLGLKKNQRIVVFCQSSGCGYADEIANFLKLNGYNHVVIYRGGYREWIQQQP